MCVHSRSQDIVGFGHALVFVIALAALAVAALPCLGLPTTYSRISLASLPQSPVLVSLTHSHTVSLSAHTYQVIYSLTHTHSDLLSHALFVHSSSFRSFVRLPNRTLTTTKKFSRTAAARCPFTRLGLDWPRVLLLAVCVCWCCCLCCFALLRTCLCACCRRRRLCRCVCAGVGVGVGVSSRRFVLCWLDNDNDNGNDNRATAAAAAEPAKTRSPLDASQ